MLMARFDEVFVGKWAGRVLYTRYLVCITVFSAGCRTRISQVLFWLGIVWPTAVRVEYQEGRKESTIFIEVGTQRRLSIIKATGRRWQVFECRGVFHFSEISPIQC